MIFSSLEFLFLFLPIALLGTILTRRMGQRWALLWLGLCSAFFYTWWNPVSIFLLAASIGFNFAAGERIRKATAESHAARYLALAVTANLLALVYFKYSGFILASISDALRLDVRYSPPELPLGISFFTFTQIAYLVDTRRNRASSGNLPSYWLFVTYFPHLIAGPVLHHAQFIPQLQRQRAMTITRTSLAVGLTLLAIGLAKKTLLADPLGAYASLVFDDAATGARPLFVESWVGALCYSFQLYFDFSGYSDMALGVSRTLNLKLPANFLSPYKATSIIAFWRRWHVSLSSFLRDYLYIPLGGSRSGSGRTKLNMFITMLLGGMWHGAGWTFAVWGAFHGVLLLLNHGWRELTANRLATSKDTATLPVRLLGGAITFSLVLVGWTIFRSADLPTAVRMLQGLCGANGLSLPEGLASAPLGTALHAGSEGLFAGSGALRSMGPNRLLLLLPVAATIVWLMPNTSQIFRNRSVVPRSDTAALASSIRWHPNLAISLIAAALAGLAILAINSRSEFLYFQF